LRVRDVSGRTLSPDGGRRPGNRGHGEEKRDRSTLETSYLAFLFLHPDGDEARRLHREYALARGMDLDAMGEQERAARTARHVVGSPDEVAEQVQRRVLDQGIDGVVVNMVANGHEPGMVRLAGETLGPLVH
jgi:alkanesulfonate monooxygenase SsuD/methylene tetrahydromethanopterin reductase-like flavin-dependent oxidoreductase (luciferase family)